MHDFIIQTAPICIFTAHINGRDAKRSSRQPAAGSRQPASPLMVPSPTSWRNGAAQQRHLSVEGAARVGSARSVSLPSDFRHSGFAFGVRLTSLKCVCVWHQDFKSQFGSPNSHVAHRCDTAKGKFANERLCLGTTPTHPPNVLIVLNCISFFSLIMEWPPRQRPCLNFLPLRSFSWDESSPRWPSEVANLSPPPQPVRET